MANLRDCCIRDLRAFGELGDERFRELLLELVLQDRGRDCDAPSLTTHELCEIEDRNNSVCVRLQMSVGMKRMLLHTTQPTAEVVPR